ncbi:MAG: hypothetical protein ACI3XQ_06700 [Eubacteriales bacterium]
MDRIDKALRSNFVTALVWSVCMAVGVPMIVFGAINMSSGNYPPGGPLLVLGISFSGSGFYAVPLLWVAYGQKRELRQLVYAIEKQDLCTVARLASHMNMSEKKVRSCLDICFSKGYLPGFIRDGDTLSRVTVDHSAGLHSVECPCCAARFEFSGPSGRCPYCGTVYVEKG